VTGKPPYDEPELTELVRSIDVRAPERLHREVQALVDEAVARRSAPSARLLGGRAARLRLGGALAVAAVVAVALALALGTSGSGGALTLRETSPLTLRTATIAAPAQSASHPAHLDASVGGVWFPYWEGRFGWRSSGARVDRVGGREVTTVFYTDRTGQRIGYAIAAGPAPSVSGGVLDWRAGTPYRLMDENGAHVVAWTRDGHLCVVSGRGVSSATLLTLASSGDDVAS
jgi:hypothetical protein